MDEVAHRVLRFVRSRGLLVGGETVVVGLSGGPDSVALALVLKELSEHGLALDLHLAHLDHGLRGAASRQDARFCREFADRQGLPIETTREDVAAAAEREGLSIEAAARTLRYQFLERAAAELGADAVATGHHADDLAETVLMRLMRGTGLSGLAAIRPRRPLSRENPHLALIRPLLGVRKAELIAFLTGIGQRFREDETNRDTVHTRNRVRHVLLPVLGREFPAFSVGSLCALAESAAEADALIQELTEERWPALCAEEGPDGVSLRADALAQAPAAVRKAACARALIVVAAGPAPALRAEHYADLSALPSRPVGTEVTLPGGLTAHREHGLVHFRRREPSGPLPARPLAVPGQVTLPEVAMRITCRRLRHGPGPDELGARLTPREACLDAAEAGAPLSVRSRRPGDRFHPLGAPGGHRLKQFFIDRKVPRHERDRIPLVTAPDGRIAWVVGHEIGEEFKVRAAGRPALHLRAARVGQSD